MLREVQILFVENAPADAVIINHELRKGGLAFRLKRVESKESFLQELELNPPEVILSDHGLPSFDGFTALALTRERYPNVPFIFVTGGMGEEKTIEAFERGAADCVLKKDLCKLASVVQRALREVRNKFLRQAGEADRERLIGELHETLTVKKLALVLPICSLCKRIREAPNRWQPIEIYLRDCFHVTFKPELCPDCAGQTGADTQPKRGHE